MSSDALDPVVAAAAAGNRPVPDQIARWARIGMAIDRSTSATVERARAVAAGKDQFRALTQAERVIAHALVDAAIAERAARARFGPSRS